MLTAKILQYDYLHNVNYLAEIVTSASQLELCDTINALLQSEDMEEEKANYFSINVDVSIDCDKMQIFTFDRRQSMNIGC